MIKAIIFDFDGVIIESANIKTKAFAELFKDYPDKVDDIIKYHLNNMGISRFIKFKKIYSDILKIPLLPEEETELGKKFSELVFEEINKVPHVPGVLNFLENNYNKFTLFIASGTPQEELIDIAKRRGIFHFFKEIHGSPAAKTDIIKNIIYRYNWSNKEVVFIGDAETDHKAGSAVGVWFIARISPESNQLFNYPYRISNFYELEQMIYSVGGY